MDRAAQAKSKQSSSASSTEKPFFSQRPFKPMTVDEAEPTPQVKFANFDLQTFYAAQLRPTVQPTSEPITEVNEEPESLQRSPSNPIADPGQPPIARSPAEPSLRTDRAEGIPDQGTAPAPYPFKGWLQRQAEKAAAGQIFTREQILQREAQARVQAKLTVGAPGDRYEQEADAIAAKVMTMPDVQPQTASHPEEEEGTVQTKPLSESIASIQREAMPAEPEELQTKPLTGTLQREVIPEAEETVQTKRLQRSPDGGLQAGSGIETQLNNSRGGGSPLAGEVRSYMEPRFGADFSQVRVHTDSSAVQMNQELGAQAFTHKNDIYYGAGKAPSQDALTAHELTHTIQQTGGGHNKVQTKCCACAEEEKQLQAKELPGTSSVTTDVNRTSPQLKKKEKEKAVPHEATSDRPSAALKTQQQAPQERETVRPPEVTQASTKRPANLRQSAERSDLGGKGAEKGVSGSSAPPASPQGFGSGGIGGKTEQQASQPVAQPAVASKTHDPGQILEQLTNTPPTQASAAYTQAQSASVQALESQRQQVQATLPEIPAPTGLPAQPSVSGNVGQSTGNASAVKDESTKQLSVEQSGPKAPPQPTMHTGQPGGDAPGQGQSNPSLGLPAQFGSSSMPGASNGEVSTSAGERPKVNLTGDADPSQMSAEQAQSGQQVQSAKAQAASGIHQDYGENAIFPKTNNETLKANKELSQVAPPQGKMGTMPVLSPEVAGGLNQGLAPFYREKVGAEHNKYQVGKQKFDADSANAKADSNQKVKNLNQEATQKQLEEQKKAKQEVTQARQGWKAELDNADKIYQEKAGTATQEHRGKIDQEKTKGEAQADQHLKEAEQKAEEEKKKADDEARKKEEEAKKTKSVWEKIGDTFSSIWEGIKSAVNAIYDAVRQVVKGIFEAVKQVVNTVIDLARKAIVGLIKAFGEVLKVLVQVVFAAFPEISKKFTDLIDQAVNKATQAVNAVADFLQKTISSVLDFLANTLDKLLSLVQDLWKGIFTVIGMILTGQFEELIKRFNNLIEGGKAMPPQFETAGIEELMGGDVDLDKPLAPEELAQAKQAGVSLPDKAGKDTPQPGEAEELPSQPWTEDNVGVDAVEQDMELSPEVTDELVQQTNGEGEVLLAESDDQSRAMDAIMSEATGGQQTGGEQEPQIPDDGLTPKQRASVKWELMKEGIKTWFSDNWPKLLAGLIAATAVIIAAIVASGGAVLAALPVLLEILTVVFAADAIAKVGGYLRDYLSKSWEGDIQGGGKSLAKALAAGAIELIMLLTAGAGKAAFKGAKAVAKGAQVVAKAAAKGAMKVFRGVIKGIKYIIQKGKVLFKGLAGTGVGKQFKRLKDLGKGLLDRMRFKAFRIRVANGWFRLEGLINPWVLIAEGKIKTEIEDAQGKPQAVDRTTPKATFITEDELKAVEKGGKVKQEGAVKEWEVHEYKHTTAPAKGKASKSKWGEVGDNLTGDHLPSNGALLKAKETEIYSLLENKNALKGALSKLGDEQKDEITQLLTKRTTNKDDISKTIETAKGSPLTPAEKKALQEAIKNINKKKGEIENNAVTVVLKDTTHESLSRTYGGKNTQKQIAEDAKDLGQAFRKDAEAIFDGLHKDGKLNPEIVGAYMRAYRENASKGVFSHSDEADTMFMSYLDKVKIGTTASSSSPNKKIKTTK